VFLHKYHPSKTEVAVDIYHEGRFVRTVGPFPGRGNVHLADSGAFALSTGGYETRDSIRVVTVDPRGNVTGELRASARYSGTEATDPEGRGVIYTANDSSETKFWAEPGQSDVPLDVCGQNSHVVCWLGKNVLFHEWPQEGQRYSLIDPETGKSIWRAPSVRHTYEANVPNGDWLFAYDLETEKCGDREFGRHKVAVLSAASGDTLHVWRSSDSDPLPERARLLGVEGSAYFITQSEFSRLDRADVLAGRYGWEAFGEGGMQPEELSTTPGGVEEVEVKVNSSLRVWLSEQGTIAYSWNTNDPTVVRVTKTAGFDLVAVHKIQYSIDGSEFHDGGRLISGRVWQDGSGATHYIPVRLELGQSILIRSQVSLVEARGYDEVSRMYEPPQEQVLWKGLVEGIWSGANSESPVEP
jgi:hypothetical protein